MSEQWQIRRGTTQENDDFIGAQGEITMDTQKKQLRVHDGSTQGGAGIIDPVVAFQTPNSGNNYTWFRKYASGWVEQGGLYIDNSGSGTTEYNVVFPITMANNTYITNCFTDEINYSNVSPDYPLFCSALTTTGMTLKASWRRANYRYHWEVKGMAAN